MDSLTVLTLATLVWKFVALVKNLWSTNWDQVLTQVIAWGAGIALVILTSRSNVASTVKIWGTTLNTLNGYSLVLLGLAVSSFGGAAVEVKKALDSNDSAKQATLFRPKDADGKPLPNPPVDTGKA